MTLIKKHRVRTKTSSINTLPEMLVSALANHEDFVVTCETDPDTKKKSLYVMTGDLITPDMLAILKQQIERKKGGGKYDCHPGLEIRRPDAGQETPAIFLIGCCRRRQSR